VNGRCESTLSLPVAFLVSFFHLFPLPVLASPHLFIHTSFSLRPCRHRSHSLSVSAITASHLRRHHHFFLSVSLSRLRLRGLILPLPLLCYKPRWVAHVLKQCLLLSWNACRHRSQFYCFAFRYSPCVISPLFQYS